MHNPTYMSEFEKIMKYVFATPEVLEASQKQLQMVLDDIAKTDHFFPKELSPKMFQNLHTYFFRHQFSTLKEDMSEKIKNWVLFHQRKYEQTSNEREEKK